MISDTSFDLNELEQSKNTASHDDNATTYHIGGSDIYLESNMWNVIDIRSETITETVTSGGGGHVTGYGGFVSGNISPVRSHTTNHTTYTYFLENSDGHRLHFSLMAQLDVVVGDELFVVASNVKNKKNEKFVPMTYTPAYNHWEIWKHAVSATIDQTKFAKILHGITIVLSLLIALLGYAIGVSDASRSEMAGMYYIFIGPCAAVISGLITYLIFAGISHILLMPVRMKFKRKLKALQKSIL